MPAVGPFELIIVLVLVVIVFGAGRLGDMGPALGKSIKEFRASIRSANEEDEAKPESAPAEGSSDKT